MHIVFYILQDWSGQNASSIASEICGFITVLSGTIILHATRDQEPPPPQGIVWTLFPKLLYWESFALYSSVLLVNSDQHGKLMIGNSSLKEGLNINHMHVPDIFNS